MKILGVILARSGSKGLRDKCVRPVCGRAMIEYTFDHALQSELLTAVVLSTDSDAARALARRRNIDVLDRPSELACGTATIDAAVRHAVKSWERAHQTTIDAVAILYANIPVRAAGAIDRCIQKLEASGGSSVRTVAPIGRHHPDWQHRLEGDRMLQYRANSTYRRQDLEPLYYHDGAVIVVRREALFGPQVESDPQAFLGNDRRAYIQEPQDAVDVDEPGDLLIAEGVLRSLSQGDRPSTRADFSSNFWRHRQTSRSTFVIAEIGVNHDGNPDKARRLIDAAVDAGADAVKFQVFRADELATSAAPTAGYQRQTAGDSQQAMLRKLELSDAEFRRLRDHAQSRGIGFLATPFGISDVDRVAALDCLAIKIASTDLTNSPLLRKAAHTGLPLLVSTGAATADEIIGTAARLRAWGVADRLAMLHCVSSYPTPLAAINLRAIASLSACAGLPVGFSDHTTSAAIGAWAVAAGACILEKHITLDRSDRGPDHASSLDAAQFADYVAAVRQINIALGTGEIGLRPVEEDVRRVARKSVVAARDLPAGTAISPEMLAIKRPAGGIEPDSLDALIGRKLATAVAADSPLDWRQLA